MENKFQKHGIIFQINFQWIVLTSDDCGGRIPQVFCVSAEQQEQHKVF